MICTKAVITLVFNEKVATSMKRADMIAFIKSQLDQKPTAIHGATVKHPFTVTEKPPKLPRAKAPPTEEEESSKKSCNYSLHNEESNNPFSADCSRSNHSEYPSPAAPPAAARSMSGYLYRWLRGPWRWHWWCLVLCKRLDKMMLIGVIGSLC
jgi:hypothetical protein